MSEPENTSAKRRCAQCGTELLKHATLDLCPKCLLQAGLGLAPDLGPGGTVVTPSLPANSRGLPQPGEQMGHYAILRLLGAGGMGAVFEAEDLESGRRVALKVLSHSLDSPEARERFFREGRLAASINHPNSVYVFGTEEIGGTPVIAMELVAGGTLQHRVRARGPLPIGEAVDSLLQIIAGLDAAQRIGILHRDIKPSNCFRSADGTVKIGDFGLSISTAIRTEPALTVSGVFLGTPAFCSPEQLRGDELNARSDMYAVGATLFYLLTGRTPFEAGNVVQLLATVLEKRAPSSRKFRPEIPGGLAKVMQRCLEKQPGDRYKSYTELANALAPYSTTASTPATLGLRFLAGVVDHLVLSLASVLAMWPVLGSPINLFDLASQRSTALMVWMFSWLFVSIMYFAVCEGFRGATLGKTLCHLRVVRLDNGPPGFLCALARACIYVAGPAVPYCLVFGANPRAYLSAALPFQYLMGLSFEVILASLFCTVRRRNGFAAIQDLVTRTRVISRTAVQARPVLSDSEPPPCTLAAAPAIGPYHVLQDLGQSPAGNWFLGYDLRLLRRIWIRTVPAGTASVPANLRNIGRIGRLRWLTGRRSAGENWDAFESVGGEPLLNLLASPQSWDRVRFWLFDLATEISAATAESTLPTLALDRVWITTDGRAKLLDFPAPSLLSSAPFGGPGESTLLGQPASGPPRPIPNAPASDAAAHSCIQFLENVAASALAGGVQPAEIAAAAVKVPLPLHARGFLKALPQITNPEVLIGSLRPLLQRVAAVSRLRRSVVVAGCLAFPAVVCCAMLFGMNMMDQWNKANPGLMELNALLYQRSAMQHWAKKMKIPTDRQFSVYIATHYRTTITNANCWSNALAMAMIKGENRRFAEQSVAGHPAPGAEEITEADAALKPHLAPPEAFSFKKQPWLFSVAVLGTFVVYVCIPALLAALLFRGGLVALIAGVAFVRRDGVRASRLRTFWRSLLAWSPVGLGLMSFGLLHSHIGSAGASLSGWVLAFSLTIISILLPDRGLQDRLAGTWPVPR